MRTGTAPVSGRRCAFFESPRQRTFAQPKCRFACRSGCSVLSRTDALLRLSAAAHPGSPRAVCPLAACVAHTLSSLPCSSLCAIVTFGLFAAFVSKLCALSVSASTPTSTAFGASSCRVQVPQGSTVSPLATRSTTWNIEHDTANLFRPSLALPLRFCYVHLLLCETATTCGQSRKGSRPWGAQRPPIVSAWQRTANIRGGC